MKALKVFCVILTVITIIMTGIMFAINRFLSSEVKSVTNKHESLIATVQSIGEDFTYTIKDSEITAMPEAQYLDNMKQAETGTIYALTSGGVLAALFIAGAVVSGKVAKRRNAGFAAA